MIVITRLDAILKENSYVRVNGNVAADGTATQPGDALRSAFRRLNKLGYKLEDPRNLSEKHIRALCKDWLVADRTPKTMGVYLSTLRIFSEWIGKPGLVKDLPYYLPDMPKKDLRTKTAVKSSKSWDGNGVDICQKIIEADALDWRFGLMIRIQVAFGFRRHEVVCLKPWKILQEDRLAAQVTKGSRPRDIFIQTDVQRDLVELVKSKIKGKTEAVGWKERRDGRPSKGNAKVASYEYSLGRYDRLMAKLGITKAMANCTGHGLRAQYAENAALIRNLIPPTLGGTAGQMPRDESEVVRLELSESLGHSRISITNPYIGSFGRNYTPDEPDRAMKVINAGMAAITVPSLTAIPPNRMVDCMKLLNDLIAAGIYGADVRKVAFLWERHSRRHATEWLKPSDESNLAALEVAAMWVLALKDPDVAPPTQ
jgi:integrase